MGVADGGSQEGTRAAGRVHGHLCALAICALAVGRVRGGCVYGRRAG
jgi:hypothetical protein